MILFYLATDRWTDRYAATEIDDEDEGWISILERHCYLITVDKIYF